MADWVDGDNDQSGWQLDDEAAAIQFSAEAFEAWDDWRRWGNYPYPGGRNAQPLKLLVHMRAIETTYSAFVYRKQTDHDGRPADLTKLSATQLEILAWLDGSP